MYTYIACYDIFNHYLILPTLLMFMLLFTNRTTNCRSGHSHAEKQQYLNSESAITISRKSEFSTRTR